MDKAGIKLHGGAGLDSARPFPSVVVPDDPNAEHPLIRPVKGFVDENVRLMGPPPYNLISSALQDKIEKYLLTQPTCDTYYLSDISPRTYQLNINKDTIPAMLSYDSNYQSEMECTVDAMIDVDRKYLRYKLKSSITQVRKIASGNYGTAYEVFVRNYPWFVIKTTRADDETAEANAVDDTIKSIRHGAVVGLHAINKLRSKIPTFMHTYGAFICGMTSPVFNTANIGQETIKMCDPNKRDAPHVILENIRNAVTLQEFCTSNDCSALDLASIILQITSAIRLAHRECDFTHYDLNLFNVLIQRAGAAVVSIKITGESSSSPEKWLRASVIARIIDFDMAHVVVGDYHLGVTDRSLNEYGISPFLSHPGYDIIKLITILAQALDVKHRITEVYQFLEKWKLLAALYSAIQISLTLEQRVAIMEISTIGAKVLDFINVKVPAVEDYGQGLALAQVIDADVFLYKTQQVCETYLGSELFSSLPPNTINTAKDQHSLMGWQEYTQMILDRNRLPGSIMDYYLAVSATKRYTTGKHCNDILTWLVQTNYELLFNQEYLDLSREIHEVWDLLKSQGASIEVMDNVGDIIERVVLWIEAVQSTAPPMMLSTIEKNQIPALQSLLKFLADGANKAISIAQRQAPQELLSMPPPEPQMQVR